MNFDSKIVPCISIGNIVTKVLRFRNELQDGRACILGENSASESQWICVNLGGSKWSIAIVNVPADNIDWCFYVDSSDTGIHEQVVE